MTDSQAALLAAAAEEFARHGLKGTRVQAIVQRAGVNERMIYHHFGSKEGLYQAVLLDLRHDLARRWFPLLEKAVHLPPYDGMRYALAGFYDAVLARPTLPALLAHEWLSGYPISSFPSADQLPAAVRELYVTGQRDGVFVADRPFEVAYLISMGALIGLAVVAPRLADGLRGESPDGPGDGLRLGPAALRDQIVDQLVDGMTGPPSS